MKVLRTVKNYNFGKDLVIGEKGEAIIKNFLIERGFEFINDNKTYHYDLNMLNPNKKETKFEVKTDVYCYPEMIITIEGEEVLLEERDSGNMFIEFESWGKLSGISVTEAPWFIMYYPFLNEVYFIRTQDLRDIIEQNNLKTVTGCGDPGSNTKGYLIRRTGFQKLFNKQTIDTKWVI